ncbi:MAG: benzoate/H(+) symporter BenE family transporter [Neisseriaceae bacterium]|nr:benzoate/H(+) symporter BenE family transporter [Neisseriaceae bacterium]
MSQSLRQDLSLSAVVAGFLAVLISYSGPLLILFQAATVAGVGPDMIASWVWGISIGAGLTGLWLSWRLKVPIITAWSAPGSALLVSLFPQLSLGQMVGAYLTAAVLLGLIGLSGYFDRLLRLLPKGVAAGMMGGILFQFCSQAFQITATMPLLAFAMVLVYLLAKRWQPRYAIVWVAGMGLLLATALGLTDFGSMRLVWGRPIWITPEWDWASTLSLALPLLIVSLTGQFMPGMAVLHLSGYVTPARPILLGSSLSSIAVACAGGVTIVLAAITAALCTGKEAHEAADRRYIAGMANGVFYLFGGLFAGSIVLLFAALPSALVALLAGLALIGAMSSNLSMMMAEAEHREAAVLAFLVTASGMVVWGLGAAFWGIVIGVVASVLFNQTPLRQWLGRG